MSTENAVSAPEPSILERDNASNLAYFFTPPEEKGLKLPIVMFCGGYRSDMRGTKASYFEEQCRKRGQGYVRFDYRGHGDSDGVFEDSIEALKMLNEVGYGKEGSGLVLDLVYNPSA